MDCSFKKQNNVTIVNAFPGILDNSKKIYMYVTATVLERTTTKFVSEHSTI